MKIETFVTSIVISLAILTGFFSLFADVTTTYNLHESNQFDQASTQKAISEIETIQNEMYKTMLGSGNNSQATEQTNDADKNNVGFWAFTKASFQAIWYNAKLIGPIATLITGAGLFLKVNPSIIATMLSLLSLALIFSLIAFIRNRRA